MPDANTRFVRCLFLLLMNVATKRSLGSSPVLMQRISIEQPTIVLQHRQLILDFYFNEMLDEAKKEIRHCFVPPPLSLPPCGTICSIGFYIYIYNLDITLTLAQISL